MIGDSGARRDGPTLAGSSAPLRAGVLPDEGRRDVECHEPGHPGLDPEPGGRDRWHRRVAVLEQEATLADVLEALLDDGALEPGRHADHRQAGDHRADLADRMAGQDLVE